MKALKNSAQAFILNDPPVSMEDINLWLERVPRLSGNDNYRAYYVRCWDVVGKIKRAKIAGTFPPEVMGERGLY